MIVFEHVEKKEYEKMCTSSKWFSPIQIDDFEKAKMISVDGIPTLVFNYVISEEVAFVFFTVFNTQNLHTILGNCLADLKTNNPSLREVSTYLLNPLDELFLKNDRYSFINSGKHKNGIRIDGELHDLLIYSFEY